jgi:hypothetical protein
LESAEVFREGGCAEEGVDETEEGEDADDADGVEVVAAAEEEDVRDFLSLGSFSALCSNRDLEG